MCANLYSSAHHKKREPIGSLFLWTKTTLLLAYPFVAATDRPHPGGGVRVGDWIKDVLSGIRRGCPGAGQELEESAGLVRRGNLIWIEPRFTLRHAEHIVARLTIGICRSVDDRDDVASTSATVVG